VVLWIVAVLGLASALVALALARRLARKVEALTQSYWELRYDYTRLRSQVQRLDPEQQEVAPEPAAPTPSVSFIPLASVRKRDQ
jgi:hypothetical protein